MKHLFLLAGLLLAFSAHAGNDNANSCGNNGNNCNQGGDVTATGGNSHAGAAAGAVAGAAALAGASVGDVTSVAQGGAGGHSTAIAAGGAGGKGGEGGTGVGFGGWANQGQQQSNVGLNSLDSKIANTVGQTTNASSANDNRSSNTTLVGGDTTLVERNVAPIYMGPLTPTNCGGSVGAGGGDRNGNALISWTWVGKECKLRMLGDRYQALGQVDVACELYASTKTFRKAAKKNPRLAALDCSVKPAPVVVPTAKPNAAITFPLTDRVPRG